MELMRHRFTVEVYHKMGEVGILSEDDRIELIDGEVVEMTLIGDPHVESVIRLTRLLSRWTSRRSEGRNLFISVQSTETRAR